MRLDSCSAVLAEAGRRAVCGGEATRQGSKRTQGGHGRLLPAALLPCVTEPDVCLSRGPQRRVPLAGHIVWHPGMGQPRPCKFHTGVESSLLS